MTGVHIVKIDGVFTLEIQEGVLLPDGGVDKNTIHWKQPHNVRKVPISLKRNKFYLDNIDVDHENAVLTGIRFEEVGEDAIAIALHFSKFNVSSGTVTYLGDIGWKSNKDVTKR